MNMTGNILLCARNSTGGGAYDGQISQLAIFNTTLVSRQVAALYLGFRVSLGSLILKPPPIFPALQTEFSSDGIVVIMVMPCTLYQQLRRSVFSSTASVF